MGRTIKLVGKMKTFFDEKFEAQSDLCKSIFNIIDKEIVDDYNTISEKNEKLHAAIIIENYINAKP